ncbi:MAG: hypothetical protein K1X89_12835 [Myxococcaceae bacterium]|nr:hypothetical protein [Myxococcaceae bacterium]
MTRAEAVRHVRARLKPFALERDPVAALVAITDEQASDWERVQAAVLLALQGRREAIPLLLLVLAERSFADTARSDAGLLAALALSLLEGPAAAAAVAATTRPFASATAVDRDALSALTALP